MKRIIYMGTPNYAKEILKTLLDDSSITVPLVITQPDRKSGRGGKLKPPEVKVLAEEYHLKLLQPERLTDDGVYESIVEAESDFIIVSAFGQLLPKNILNISPCINLHASLLPKYRGASPVQQALLNGDEFTGVTAMLMDEGLDSGDILGYRYFKIPKNMTLSGLMDRLTKDACKLTLNIVHNFESIEPIKQVRADATYCRKIKKSDGTVYLREALKVYNKYRAFEGWPNIFLKNGTKLFDVEMLENDSRNVAGEILSIGDKDMVVGCTIGTIKIGKLQPPSKRVMDAKSYCVGRGLKVGDTLLR